MKSQDISAFPRDGQNASRAWHVRIDSGPMAGSVWPITESRLVIGRGLGCQICIDDPSVSRVQCELYLENAVPHFLGRSKRNATLINGQERDRAKLESEDILEFCGYRMTVDSAGADGGPGRPQRTPDVTTQCFSDSVYLREPVDPQTPAEFSKRLVRLYKVLRLLTRSEDLESLVDELRSHLSEQFARSVSWIAWGENEASELVFHPPTPPKVLKHAPIADMKNVMKSREGVLSKDYQRMCVPLVHAGGSYGAIAITYEDSDKRFAPTDLDYLLALCEGVSPIILAAERLGQMSRDVATLRKSKSDGARLLGNSEEIHSLRKRIQDAAKSRGNVLILGETGVGKELAARLIHAQSPRASGPYVAVNCATISDELFESEMFGHEKGAFTGAVSRRKGLYEEAHGGTIFLDEISELSAVNQAKLLRVAEDNTFRRIGGNKDITVDVRIISATNRPLPDSNAEHLRIDLYYRLSTFSIWIPSLRDRMSDIPELATHFLGEFGPDSPSRPTQFSEEGLSKLLSYSWPGNVRELRNVIESACFRSSGRTIHIRDILLNHPSDQAPRGVGIKSLKELERDQLLATLIEHQYNVADAANSLGVAPSTMYYKLRKHKIPLRRAQT